VWPTRSQFTQALCGSSGQMGDPCPACQVPTLYLSDMRWTGTDTLSYVHVRYDGVAWTPVAMCMSLHDATEQVYRKQHAQQGVRECAPEADSSPARMCVNGKCRSSPLSFLLQSLPRRSPRPPLHRPPARRIDLSGCHTDDEQRSPQ
jgi:hypothetical protein